MTRIHTDIQKYQGTDGKCDGLMRIHFPIGFLFMLLLVVTPCLAATDANPPAPVMFDGKYLTIDAKKILLETLIRDIRDACGVEITGLENRLNDPVTIQVEKRSPETVFKRLLRDLGEENYAFEFSNAKLKKISVFPGSNVKAGSQAPFGFSGGKQPESFSTIVEIQSIVANSQAQELDLRPGDIVAEYDGVKISASQELIREVKQKTDLERVELKVIRDGEPMSFVLKGGLIGIRINTKGITNPE